VAEDNWLSFSPILVIDLRSVFNRDSRQLCTSIQRVLHNSQLLFIPLEWLRKAAHPFDCGSPNVLRP
jgi:hypothetical protein